MPLPSDQAKVALREFARDLEKIASALYKATKRPVPPEQKDAAVAAGRKKLADYEALVASLSDAFKAEAANDFGRYIDAIREYLAKATGDVTGSG
jgi:hypothetical protein